MLISKIFETFNRNLEYDIIFMINDMFKDKEHNEFNLKCYEIIYYPEIFIFTRFDKPVAYVTHGIQQKGWCFEWLPGERERLEVDSKRPIIGIDLIDREVKEIYEYEGPLNEFAPHPIFEIDGIPVNLDVDFYNDDHIRKMVYGLNVSS